VSDHESYEWDSACELGPISAAGTAAEIWYPDSILWEQRARLTVEGGKFITRIETWLEERSAVLAPYYEEIRLEENSDGNSN
jgi:hypothetical protein